MNADMVFWWAAGLVAVATALRLVAYPFYREMKEAWAWWRKFQRDWDGEMAEPGRSAVPGVMSRLNIIDGQLHRNGGESLKDKVVETWEFAKELNGRVTKIEDRQREIQEDQRMMSAQINRLDSDVKHVGGHA